MLEDQIIVFFCICKNWVDARISLSQSSWLMSNLALSRRLLRWVGFSKVLPNLIFSFVSTSRNKFFNFASLWEAKFSKVPKKMQRGDEDQSCRGKLVLPQGLKKMIQVPGHVSLSILLYLCLWRYLLWHKLIQSRILLNFWRVFAHSCSWYRGSPARRRDFLGFDIADRNFPLVHCM